MSARPVIVGHGVSSLRMPPIAASRSTLRDGDEGFAVSVRRAPLMLKIAGASAPLLAAVLLVTWWNYRADGLPRYAFGLVLVVLVATVVVHVALVAFALQPLAHLGRAIEVFGRGDESVTVRPSPWADRDVAELEHTVARLLDVVRRERSRSRELAGRVLQHADAEQFRIARELFDSTAQSMAALLLELRAASTGVQDRELQQRLDGVRRIAAGVLDEVQELSLEARSRWSANHGLHGALQHLVREHNAELEARLTVEASVDVNQLDPTAATMVYRTAHSALRRAIQDRCLGLDLGIHLDAARARVVLEVHDERVPQVPAAPQSETMGMLRERAELLGGSLELHEEGDRRRLRLQLPVRLATESAGEQTSGVL